jgi:iron complex outermembrane receptor protein
MFSLRTAMMSGVAAVAVLAATPAFAEVQSFDIAAQSARTAIPEFGRQSGIQILASQRDVAGQSVPAIKGEYEPREALAMLLAATNLRVASDDGRTVTLVQAPQSGSAAGGGAEVEAVIVTAQKREEAIQDVPIAISAFTQKDLEAQKIEGGFDLLKAIPNVTFSKNNFTGYNFSIRGVGTKAISATTDPGVSVSFNNTGLIQNRLFEQEYFDIERVEVLRGPQGTLYGRNATSGVINLISAKPKLGQFEAFVKAEVGNYQSKRAQGMINIPIIDDKLAVRIAGAITDRVGYDFNSITDNPVNGRSLWSVRTTIGFEPTENIRGNLVWERFEENDDRLRTGKQLCHRDPGKTVIGNHDGDAGTPTFDQAAAEANNPSMAPVTAVLHPALFSQGCLPGNLYDDNAFSTPNGLSIPFVFGIQALGYAGFPIGYIDGVPQSILQLGDPYGGMRQSTDMRSIASIRDPRYEAQADLIQLNLEFDLSDTLTVYSQTAYNKDSVYSFQDFNRFNTLPVFTDTSNLEPVTSFPGPGDWRDLAPGGVFCDPQLGCSNRMAGFDISQASAEQFSQEFRLQSDFDAPVNFSLGANYTKFDVLVDYYVMINMLTAAALIPPFNNPVDIDPGPGIDGEIDFSVCGYNDYLAFFNNGVGPSPADDPRAFCPYIDPNPVESINGEGHNYFRSKNPYKLKSWAAFGEAYWQIREDLKLTAGIRYTDDTKTFIPVPSQVLNAYNFSAAGTVSKGYPEKPPIVQNWGEFTGRLVIDWKPVLPFTDDTMVYASFSRGYKGGGANPPQPGFATEAELREALPAEVLSAMEQFGMPLPILQLTAAEYSDTFDAEFVNAFEVGSKNTILGGGMTFNTTAFYYDYAGYQVSQIRDRTAVNENFDATIWGLEFETLFSPTRNFQIVANLGYLDTSIADGETSVDIMNRTQSNPDYTVVKGWLQLPSNCVVPTHIAERYLQTNPNLDEYWQLCGGLGGFAGITQFFPIPADVNFGMTPYDVDNYPELNGGAGIAADLGGNELPNAPHWTMNVGAQYSIDREAWKVTVRADAYWQSQSWHRVYNLDPFDKLHGWYNLNLSTWLEIPEHDLKIEFYVKNVLDKSPITDAFINSDDQALTTNVFVLDPRLIGLSIRKGF